MALAPYTTPTLVRLSLGVAVKERKDADIDTRPNEAWMKEQLYAISDTLPAALAGVMASPGTAVETRLRDLGELFCTTAVALRECVSAPLFAPKTIKDDRTMLERIDDPFKNLRDELEKTLAYLSGKLVKAYLAYDPGAVINAPDSLALASLVGLVSSPATDPVTAES